ncbi:MAG: ThiF family adenylyltransferase, partial [Gemmatimonadota bacterium]
GAARGAGGERGRDGGARCVGAGWTLGVGAFAHELASPSVAPAGSWRPGIVRLLSAGECDRFAALCREHRLTVVDTIERQLADLAAARLPAADEAERRRFVADALAAAGGRDLYGVWVHLPWESKVVHLLGPDAYFEVITNRNRDKITLEEQRRLWTKRIGVIGLSVGGEAAVTVAQEHLCGEIVLADFDGLDLSNLNRLNAGCDDLGVNKAVLVARRIAKIDPYLHVTVFEEGVTDANVERFLDGLDLLIEECDGLRMKYEIRRLAKARALNIVFAGDERGFLSIEPHAHSPDLRPFHGRIAEPQPPREAYPTRRAFMRALTEWLGGWDAISEVSRRSLERIGSTLCGYPQLGGEARYAAGQIAHVARRLLLGERLPPFIGHLDPADGIPGAPTSARRPATEETTQKGAKPCGR